MILITGAHGFVGHHLVKMLRVRIPSESIRLFDARPPTGAMPTGVQAAYGLIQDPEAVAAAVRGAAVVIHLAAIVQPGSRSGQELWQVNVEGTRNVYSAATALGCRLFLHMSSAGIYGPPSIPDPFREVDTPRPVTPYQRTKWQAEEALRQIDPKTTRLNVLRPTGMYGPGSHLEIPTYKRVLRQRWALELRGGVVVHPTHVRDTIEAVLALLDRPAPHGTVFNIGGERQILVQDLHALVAQTLGVRRWRLVLPYEIAGPLAEVAGPVLSLMGRRNPLLGGMSRGQRFSAAVDDRCFREAYPRVPVVGLASGLKEHIDWARQHRLL